MIVIGIKIRPAEALAMAPVARFAKFDSFGREEEDAGTVPASTFMDRRRLERATFWRNAFKPVK